jgi:hypothetical protein
MRPPGAARRLHGKSLRSSGGAPEYRPGRTLTLIAAASGLWENPGTAEGTHSPAASERAEGEERP